MKLLYLTHQYFPRHIGGTEVYLKGLIDHAKREGHEVRVITCHESPLPNLSDFHTQRTQFDGTDLIEIHFNLSVTPDPAKWEYSNPYTAEVVTQEIQSFKPDLVHVMHAMKLSGSVLEACQQNNVPFIVTLCDFWFICPRHTLLRWNGTACNGPKHPLDCRKCVFDLHGYGSLKRIKELYQLTCRNSYLLSQLKKAKKLIALSSFQKKLFIQNGFPDDLIEVISHGLDISSLRIKSVPQKVKTIGFIGSLVPFKGAHILIDAILLDPSLPIHCKIYGPINTDNKYISSLIEKAKNDSRISFCGGFSPEELGSVLGTFDIFAMPALWYENEPLVIKSALYTGIPVMASDIGSLPDMITHDVNGWLIPAGDVDKWSEMLKKIISQPPLQFIPPTIKTIDENAEEMLAMCCRFVGSK